MISEKKETYPDVTVHHQADPQQPIQHGILAPTRNKCGSCEWYETSGEKTFEGPVVGAMRFGRRWEVCGVVYGAFVHGYIRNRCLGVVREKDWSLTAAGHVGCRG
jgi:hypothetical protein